MSEPLILSADPDAVDVPVDDLEIVTMTRSELRAHDEQIRNRTWKEARIAGALKRSGTEALTERVSQLESFVLKLGERILDRIEGRVPSDQPTREMDTH